MTGLTGLVLVIAGLLVGAMQCAAWGPEDCCDGELFPPPVAAADAPEPIDPIALGYHVVTEVRAADVVTQNGLETIYRTDTRAETPGTVARKVASVGTGEQSAFDAVLAERRLTMSDGRPVAGDIYETAIIRDGALVLVSYDIFYDDSELARLKADAAARVVPVEIASPFAVAAPVELPAGPTWWGVVGAPDTVAPGAGPARTPADVGPSPQIPPDRERDDRDITPPSAPAPSPDVRAYVALAPQADAVSDIEVLRGRRIAMWIRATADGSAAHVISWRFISGEVTLIGPIAGRGEEPFVARWMSPSGRAAPFTLVFEARVEVATGIRPAPATVTVTVRSPALVE